MSVTTIDTGTEQETFDAVARALLKQGRMIDVTINTGTEQETFDAVATALLEQGRPSMGGEGGVFCRYRSEESRKCAAGHLLPDTLYHERMEGLRASTLVGIDGVSPVYFQHPALTNALQMAHDEAALLLNGYRTACVALVNEWRERWLEHMRSVAARYNLSAAVLDRGFASEVAE